MILLGKFETMTFRLRQVLTLFVLSLFSIENVAMYVIAQNNETKSALIRQSFQSDIQPLFPLLAEEIEERDQKDETSLECGLPEFTFPSSNHFLPSATGMIQSSTIVRLQVKALPRYTVFCSLLI